MSKLNLLKFMGPALLSLLSLWLLQLQPVSAIGGSDVILSSLGAGGPDIDISSDRTRLAVVYYKQDSTTGTGAVYLKSATANPPTGAGWVTSTFLGAGSNPQVAFKPGTNNIVYVVWVNSTDTAIQAARCTLSSTSAPACGSSGTVRSLQVGTLGAPDLVVDGSNVLHVAWQNSETIETARSTAADNVTSWSSVKNPGLCTGSKAGEPVLGWTSTSNKLHLAFLCGAAASTPTSIEYRRSGTVTHAWNDALEQFTIGNTGSDEILNIHSSLDNLALHASGSQVSLAWDGLRTGGTQEFSLMYVASTNQGDNWGTVIYVPSNSVAASTNPSGQNKLSTTSTLPPQEYGLRPSLVISGTLGNAAVVWQQKLGTSCVQLNNGTSDVHFVDPQNIVPVTQETLEHSKTEYSVDPDLAVGTGGARHFVFMKDNDASNCVGGTASDYAIYYRGPFTDQTNDKGETSAGQTYLPYIKK